MISSSPLSPPREVVLCESTTASLPSSFQRDAVVLSHKITYLGRLNGEVEIIYINDENVKE